jgi:hypothetical protein
VRITLESGSEILTFSCGTSGGAYGFGLAKPPASRVTPRQPVVLIRSVGFKIDPVALLKSPESLEQAIVAWDRAALTLPVLPRAGGAPPETS